MFAIGHGSQPGQEKFWHFFMLCGSCSGTCWCTSVSTCPLSPCCLPLSQFISPLFFRVVYQLICLQPIWHFLMLRRAQGQIPFCSLPCLRFWIGSLCNRFILWVLAFYYCYTMQFCWTLVCSYSIPMRCQFCFIPSIFINRNTHLKCKCCLLQTFLTDSELLQGPKPFNCLCATQNLLLQPRAA